MTTSLKYVENIFNKEGLGEKLNILDIGCSEINEYSYFLIKKAKTYVGIDPSDTAIMKAAEKTKNMTNVVLLKNSIEEFYYKDNSFDVIVCNNTLAYTNQKIALKAAYSFLKDGGIFISSVNNSYKYSLYKIIHPYKPFIKEFIHSSLVLLNSTIFYLTGIKIFHTIFIKKKYLEKLISGLNPKHFKVESDYKSRNWCIINFFFIK